MRLGQETMALPQNTAEKALLLFSPALLAIFTNVLGAQYVFTDFLSRYIVARLVFLGCIL